MWHDGSFSVESFSAESFLFSLSAITYSIRRAYPVPNEGRSYWVSADS